MRTAVGVGIGISALVIFNELQFVGRTGLALVLIAVAAVLVTYGIVLWNLVEKRSEVQVAKYENPQHRS